MDIRAKLADWLAAKDNPYFARTIVNRVWKHYMGRGLVEQVDDFRVTNPPTHPALLDALAFDLIGHKFDLRHLIRTILNSRTYQRASTPNESNRNGTPRERTEGRDGADSQKCVAVKHGSFSSVLVQKLF